MQKKQLKEVYSLSALPQFRKMPKGWQLVSVVPEPEVKDMLHVTIIDKENGGTFTYTTRCTMKEAQEWIEKSQRKTLEDMR
jgi:hypothetical protein